MLPQSTGLNEMDVEYKTNYKCQAWKTCQLIVPQAHLKNGDTQLHAICGEKSEYTRKKH
jgi:hypothetical protein